MKQGVPLPRDARRHALGWYEIAHMYKGIAEFSMRSEAAAYVNGGEAARAVQSYTFLRVSRSQFLTLMNWGVWHGGGWHYMCALHRVKVHSVPGARPQLAVVVGCIAS